MLENQEPLRWEGEPAFLSSEMVLVRLGRAAAPLFGVVVGFPVVVAAAAAMVFVVFVVFVVVADVLLLLVVEVTIDVPVSVVDWRFWEGDLLRRLALAGLSIGHASALSRLVSIPRASGEVSSHLDRAGAAAYLLDSRASSNSRRRRALAPWWISRFPQASNPVVFFGRSGPVCRREIRLAGAEGGGMAAGKV